MKTATEWKRARWFVGYRSEGRTAQVFKASAIPTRASHGVQYPAVVGPFRTRAGAEVMAFSRGPCILCVEDAEREAARRARKN